MKKIKYIDEGIRLGYIKEQIYRNREYKRCIVVKPFIFVNRFSSKYKIGEIIGMPMPLEQLHINRERAYIEFLVDIVKGLSNNYEH